jgi:hypothetical protein
MTIQAGELLLRRVRPIIRASLARGVVKTVGAEDLEELEADGMAQAANMIEAAEKAGKQLLPNSVAYYTLQAPRSGRRFGCASRTDAMSPAAALDGRVSLVSMDAPLDVFDENDDDEITLHSCLAASGEDPAAQGSRELDWDAMLSSIGASDRDLLLGTAAGVPGLEMAFRYNVTPARVTQRKRELGYRMKAELGDTVLEDCVRESPWEGHMRAYREKRACRYA